jgi:hypothetical protein
MLFKHVGGTGLLLFASVALCRAQTSGQTIDTCGQFTLSGGCLVFQADTGGAFQLDTTPGLTQSDRIHVVGTVNTGCLPSCAAATACIAVTTLAPCGSQFSGCGTLVQSGNCLVFQADSGGTFVLDQLGGFGPGDRVDVAGTENPLCGNTCSTTNGCLTVSSILACGTQFTSCGQLIVRGTCVLFVADRGGTYSLDTLASFVAGDRVRVAGTLDLTCAAQCPPEDGCITHNTIQSCNTTFVGCGTLVQGPGCVMFQADSGGTFALANTGGLSVGTRVHVTGVTGGACVNTCATTQTCIADNTIELCQNEFVECGKLVQGAECVLFQADTGASYVLDNLAGFSVGARVRVTGILDQTCVSTCLISGGCVHNNTVTADTGTCPLAPSSACPTTAVALISLPLLGLLRRRCSP